ncbi:hypothetical protein Ndes2526B_g08839 [Nannochloris sp. 'desiccata']|nr:hypothetical protein KSW81_001594 [Chlorella desiccata (nom. nud.)]KAH7616741.1 putative 39S ribosomal protein L41, mitochondrial [Chlorella desiccata (nom. nud.)]
MSAWSMLASAFVRGRRVPRSGYKQLTSKVAPRTYYKGKGCAPTGRHTRKGGYIIEPWRLPEYILPDLSGFKLKPYVAHSPSPKA